ncbi:hypothetical protein EMIHUDRAFT_98563 [Emiliania huxleyi CCMP1516]|uniref:Uncharacterized protein n=2 Tax=Emiliania huxleyi TaxID=2903 RepID=A0A0D3JP38_EMIH1|nr:hypothetical protein EMIHUDRAFT_115613 [Emiliania huxleyi CCMP1516]XP_005787991.1 hypothetical protein EMIHUDRAFT_98563 [Emiliania huxleyi CCMP1516]EOD25273.1 hypothetical protein EMIHUDRAFT_115613 [Emiliania huxleyi CCMP1516]EOD35562.1 hypothetical protein EMIHUDRAFT_98563 [Emiliania huxleyi CCMP1516]|eukprot:XP_005777702.1 hypothetical protein EMIHUDRAFT_115613 [Emiliania huxleyi CCMP1516]
MLRVLSLQRAGRLSRPLRPALPLRCNYCSRAPSPPSINSAETASKIARWSLRLNADNTFLSYHRNAIIATVAGAAMVQYRKGEGRPPLAAACLFAIGGMYMYVGSFVYVLQAWRLRTTLSDTPSWLLNALARVERRLPTAIHRSLFLQPESLRPVVSLLEVVHAHESKRLQSGAIGTAAGDTLRTACAIGKAYRNVAADGKRVRSYQEIDRERRRTSRRALPESGPGDARDEMAAKREMSASFGVVLSDLDYVAIIWLRLGRIAALHAQLAPLASSAKVVTTEDAIPLVEAVSETADQLEIALEAETKRIRDQSLLRSLLPEARLEEELTAVRALSRRCEAVRHDVGSRTDGWMDGQSRVPDEWHRPVERLDMGGEEEAVKSALLTS